MNILITGPIGSGKTTHAKIIAEKFKLCLIKTGDLIREKAKENSPDGQKCKAAIESGVMVDDDLVADLVKEQLRNCSNGFVSDSYPRRLHQIEVFDPQLDIVFFLQVSKETLEKRLLNRGRGDDTPELIEKRLEVYYAETEPIIQHFEALNRLIVIDAEPPIEEVAQAIVNHIQK